MLAPRSCTGPGRSNSTAQGRAGRGEAKLLLRSACHPREVFFQCKWAAAVQDIMEEAGLLQTHSKSWLPVSLPYSKWTPSSGVSQASAELLVPLPLVCMQGAGSSVFRFKKKIIKKSSQISFPVHIYFIYLFFFQGHEFSCCSQRALQGMAEGWQQHPAGPGAEVQRQGGPAVRGALLQPLPGAMRVLELLSRAEQGTAGHSRAEQGRAEQGRAEQSIPAEPQPCC